MGKEKKTQQPQITERKTDASIDKVTQIGNWVSWTIHLTNQGDTAGLGLKKKIEVIVSNTVRMIEMFHEAKKRVLGK